jgi:DNA polymerase-3 subunit alpha
MNAYLSAYAKAHFPKVFFASYLKFAKDKIDPQQEIKELVRNANEMDIVIHTPDLRQMNRLFAIRDNKIYFGLTDIKGLGDSVFTKILQIIEQNNTNIAELKWYQLVYKILANINSIAAKALISCGALDYIKKTRTEMLFEYDIFMSLTDKEMEKAIPIIDGGKSKLKDILIDLMACKINIKRKEVITNLISTIDNPPYSLADKIEWLSDSENTLLGAAITCSKLDSYNIEMTNTNCKEFKRTHKTDNIILAAEIVNTNITKTKNGKTPGLEMAFVTGEDQYGILDSIVLFPETWEKYRAHIFQGNILIFSGKKSKNKDSLIVDKVFVPKT